MPSPQGQLVFLGCGTSVGVPALGCRCAVCTGGDPRNQRTRCSVVLGLPEGDLLIDTTPEMRMQLLREQIPFVHAVAFTHEHADHVMGFDDLRLMQFHLQGPVPVYCNEAVRQRLEKAFDYAFISQEQTHRGAVPAVALHDIHGPFAACGATIIPVPLEHGPRFQVLGFRVGNVAYCTDVKSIPASSEALLQGLDVLVISALRYKPHPTHMNFEEAIVAARRLGARRTIFTHCNCDVDYATATKELPAGFEIAYDGLRVPLT